MTNEHIIGAYLVAFANWVESKLCISKYQFTPCILLKEAIRSIY